MSTVTLLAILTTLGATSLPLDQPMCKWEYHSVANLYTAPLVADMTPSPGLETVLCESEARVVLCLDSGGKELWRYSGPWTKRLVSTPALSTLQNDGKRRLLVTNADGFLICLDAATGNELWRKKCGETEWGGPLWADVSGDKTEEAVLGTLNNGVFVHDFEGSEIWRYQHPEGREPLQIRGVMSANDIDGDGKSELFGATKYGVFALEADGTLSWETITWDDFDTSVRTALASDGNAFLFTTSAQDNSAWGFDAKTGKTLWRTPLAGAPGQSFAITHDRVLIGDKLGTVWALDYSGSLEWTYQMRHPALASISAGDVDADSEVEVLVAGHDHNLYCIDGRGLLKWTYQAELRLMSPPTLADADGDGNGEMLLCGCDRTLRCLTLNARYSEGYLPWPSRNGNPAQTSALPVHRVVPMTTVKRELLTNGRFANGKYSEGLQVPSKDSEVFKRRNALPQGWNALPGADGDVTSGWQRKGDESGEDPGLLVNRPMTVVSDPLTIPRGTKTITVEVTSTGFGAKAKFRLTDSTGSHVECYLAPTPNGDSVCHEFSVSPGNAQHCQLYLECPAGESCWRNARVTAEVTVPAKTEVLVNQVGYDLDAPKRFVVQSDYDAREGTFRVIRARQTVYEGVLELRGRITGCYGKDWGYYYWCGDLSPVNEAGDYSISVSLTPQDGPSAQAESYSFRIADNVLWTQTASPAYEFFYYQRCGCEVPGYHKACHMDDAKGPDGTQYELWGGWHDAGDYNTYTNAPYVHGLLRAYAQHSKAFDALDSDKNGRADLLDEILWGAEHERRMIAPDGSAFGAITTGYGFWCAPELETDNKPGTGDERPITGQTTGNNPANHHAAMAKMARFTSADAAWMEPAERSLKWALDHGIKGVEQFATALDLFKVTRKEEFARTARELFPKMSADPLLAESVMMYDECFGENHVAELTAVFHERAEALLATSRNPFGVHTFGPVEKPNFFNTPRDQGGWHIGTNMYILEAAEIMAIAYSFERDSRYLTFIYDQLNWVLGCNPYNISMMEGVGDAFMPTYHHRYTFSGVKRGAVPGGIANGITWRAVGDDSPFVDMSGADIPAFESNEFWLPHNTNYLKALAHLQRARSAKP